MTAELEGFGQSGGVTTYAIVKRRGGNVWNGSEWVAYATDDRNNYAVSMAELGSSGNYVGDFPTGITDPGSYTYAVYQSDAGTVSEDNGYIGGGTVDWTGTGSATSSVGAMSGSDLYSYILRTFKRDDKGTEVYDAITDTIRDLRLRYEFDEATVDNVSTESISTLGDYKLTVETDLGFLLGVSVQDGENADPLQVIPKWQFDELYADSAVSSHRGYPRHYAVFGGHIYIGPTPDRVSFTYRLNYSSRGGTITAATTAVPFTAVDRELVKHGALSRLYVGLENADLAAVHEGIYQSRFAINKDRDRRNKGEGLFFVTPFGL